MRLSRLLPLLAAFSLQDPPLPAATVKGVPYAGWSTSYGYAALADMALAARIVLSADIARATALKPAVAGDVPPGETRYFVEATVVALVSGRVELPATVHYLVDLPDRGLKLKGMGVLLLATEGGKPGDLRLVGPQAQVPRTPENEARLRAILTAAIAPDAAPAITGIGHAFHVAGSLPGEGETQIFLRTADNRPISLSVLRRPGETPRWAVALSELIDASAAPPPRDTFLWYRLACGLPRALPAAAVGDLPGPDADQARADYDVVLEGLGPCRQVTGAG